MKNQHLSACQTSFQNWKKRKELEGRRERQERGKEEGRGDCRDKKREEALEKWMGKKKKLD